MMANGSPRLRSLMDVDFGKKLGNSLSEHHLLDRRRVSGRISAQLRATMDIVALPGHDMASRTRHRGYLLNLIMVMRIYG